MYKTNRTLSQKRAKNDTRPHPLTNRKTPRKQILRNEQRTKLPHSHNS